MQYKPLIDQFGRKIRKLRISLLDHCNLRCFYCLPSEPKFLSKKHWLTSERLIAITDLLCRFGLEQVRITGGEPTLRSDLLDIAFALSEMPLNKIGLTTNGVRLKKILPLLAKTKCQHINISLDSLQESKFNVITRRNDFSKVMSSIEEALSLNFRLKINVVLMKTINDDELENFVRFSEQTGIEVRFLELMRIGEARSPQKKLFMEATEAIGIIKEKFNLKLLASEVDSTSFRYQTDSGGTIGFIAPESREFCGTCSRWRLSAGGKLRACLMSEAGVDLKSARPEEYPRLFAKLLGMKPIQKINEIDQNMNQIGG